MWGRNHKWIWGPPITMSGTTVDYFVANGDGGSAPHAILVVGLGGVGPQYDFIRMVMTLATEDDKLERRSVS